MTAWGIAWPVQDAAVILGGHAALIALSLGALSQAPLRTARTRLRFPRRGELEPLVPAFALVLLVLCVQFIEVRSDAWVTQHAALDVTRQVYGVEGGAVAWFQAATPPWLADVWLAAYLFGYPFLIYFTPLFLLLHRDARGLALFALAFAALYAMALPFYLFLPVQDPWIASGMPWYHGRPIAFMLQERWPSIVPLYWQMTTPNNVIPSLHAGISALCAIVAWKAGYRRFAALAGAFAAAIPFASFYVGVHWLMDPLIAYAMVAVAVGAALRWREAFLGWTLEQPWLVRAAQRVAGPVAGAGAEGAGAFEKP